MNVGPFGAWRSPVTPSALAGASLRLSAVALDGDALYWLEGRPAEAGRSVLVRQDAHGGIADVTPAPFDVRSRVHEYGGGAFAVRTGVIWFVNCADQRLYEQQPSAAPRPLTPPGAWRYADIEPDSARGRLLCVREDHSRGGGPVNEIVAVDAVGGGVRVLATGHDFYAWPRLSPEGRRLAWVSWDHPDMPWDAARLWLAELGGDGLPGEPRCIAGGRDGALPGAVYQPAWSPAGDLWFVCDPAGWWNLHRTIGAGVECVCQRPAEFGRPLWQLGSATYGFAGDGSVVCGYAEHGLWRLARLDPASGTLAGLDAPATDIVDIAVAGGRVALLAGAPELPPSVIDLDLSGGECATRRVSSALTLEPEYVSRPEPLSYATGGGETSHAFLYMPCNPGWRAPEGELAPLIVMGHGGPTGSASSCLDLRVQFWTTRGFAVLDLNYRGSTGFGRAYRESLAGRWGVADVEDAVYGARHLAATRRVDGRRMAIRGGSAGGYLALAALTFHDTFSAGASYYGISDLEVLAADTHKFESRYLDSLVGPYPARADLYRERSPIHHAERLDCPVIFFQGLEDAVVPPAQAEMLVETLRARGHAVEYHAFEGEQHGFRRAETLRTCLAAELAFYGRVFGFEPAG